MSRRNDGGRLSTAPLTPCATWPARRPPWLTLPLCLAAAAWLSTASAAPLASAGVDPADPAAAVPALVYRPTLAGYRAWAAPEPRSWREVNDTVARIGGWRVYLREAHAPEPAAAGAAATAPSEAGAPAAPAAPAAGARSEPGPHGGHGGHGGGARP